MSEWRFHWSTWRGFKDDMGPGLQARAEGCPWPLPAEGIMRVLSEEWPRYAVDVEFRLPPGTPTGPFRESGPVVTGISVRPRVPMKAKGKRAAFEHEAEWPEDVEPLPLSLRDVRRLPLDRIATAALVAVRQYAEEPSPDRFDPVSEALSVPGRPRGRNKERFYKAVAELHRSWTLKGLSPAKELARRKRVSENTAHQWIYKARQLGYLEPSQRSGRRKEKQ
jgi:hypothetical protein